MDKIRYFDCNCVIGRRVVMNPGSFYKTGELLQKMKQYGIESAMVYHSMSKEYSPSVGNQLLMDEIRNYPALQGVWVVLPSQMGEFPGPSELKKEMKEKNIRAVRVFPADFSFSFSEWCCGELLSMLEDCRVPLMVDQRQITWDQLNGALSVYPKLRVILTDVHYGIGRNLYPLFKKFEHIYVETMGYKDLNGIEEICRQFGAERLIFGSGSPLYSGGAAVGMISYARISHEEKSKIAGGNLEKLLGGVMLQ